MTSLKRRLYLYTAGYRDSETGKRKAPESFYGSLPGEAAVVDIRARAYSPFAPEYTGKGVEAAVRKWKGGSHTFHHLRALGNTNRDADGKRRSPPIYVDGESGLAQLEEYLALYGQVVIFCACPHATLDSATHRCHRFFVAEEMAARIPRLVVKHLP